MNWKQIMEKLDTSRRTEFYILRLESMIYLLSTFLFCCFYLTSTRLGGQIMGIFFALFSIFFFVVSAIKMNKRKTVIEEELNAQKENNTI